MDKKHIDSVVVRKDVKINHIKGFIKKNLYKKGCIVFMFHSLVQQPRDKWEWSIKDFDSLCGFVKKMVDDNLIQCKVLRDL